MLNFQGGLQSSALPHDLATEKKENIEMQTGNQTTALDEKGLWDRKKKRVQRRL